jgi:hypothetical protein
MLQNLNFLSESINLEVEKKAEDTLLANKAVGGFDVVGYKVNGSFELNLKPENAGFILAAALGKEPSNPVENTTDDYYTHTLVGLPAQEDAPSFSIIADRGTAVKQFIGIVFDSFSLKGQSKETLKMTVNVKGKAEQSGTVNNALAIPSLPAFRFSGGTLAIDGTNMGKVTSITIDYSNGFDDGFYTISSGLYPEKPGHGLKECKVSIEAEYDSSAEALRENYLKTGNYASVTVVFYSPAIIAGSNNIPYEISFTIPNLAITKADANVAGKDRIMIKLEGQAVELSGVEPVTVSVKDAVATKYF